MNPRIVQAWSNLVNAFLQKGEVEKAVETGEKLVELAPDFGLGHNNLAYAYYLKGDFARAIKHVDTAISLGFQVHPDFLKELEPHRSA